MGFDSMLSRVDGVISSSETPDISHIVLSVDQYALENKVAFVLAKMIIYLNTSETGIGFADEYIEELVGEAASGNEELAVLLRDRLKDCVERAKDEMDLGLRLEMVDPSEGGPNLTAFNDLAAEITDLIGESFVKVKSVDTLPQPKDVLDETREAVDAVGADNEHQHRPDNPFLVTNGGF